MNITTSWFKGSLQDEEKGALIADLRTKGLSINHHGYSLVIRIIRNIMQREMFYHLNFVRIYSQALQLITLITITNPRMLVPLLTSVFKDFSGSYTWSRLILVFLPFYVFSILCFWQSTRWRWCFRNLYSLDQHLHLPTYSRGCNNCPFHFESVHLPSSYTGVQPMHGGKPEPTVQPEFK